MTWRWRPRSNVSPPKDSRHITFNTFSHTKPLGVIKKEIHGTTGTHKQGTGENAK